MLVDVFGNVHPVALARELPGGLSQTVGLLGVRRASQQLLDHLQVALPGGQVQRQVTLLVHEVRVCPVGEQHAHGIHESLARGVVHHGEAAGRVA